MIHDLFAVELQASLGARIREFWKFAVEVPGVLIKRTTSPQF
jgi:hypothetical protein